MEAIHEPSPATPKLWNPNAATLWSVLFTPVFGALIQAKNWKELDQAAEEKKSRMWIYLTVAFWFVTFFLPESIGTLPGWIWLIVWYFANGKKQVDYVKKNAIIYEKKAWRLPLSLGCLGVVVVLFISLAIGFLITAEPASTVLDLDATTAGAESGDAKAQYNLGVMYRDGQGVPQDYAEAMKWTRLAADQGFAMAQYNVGMMYYNGQGVPENKAEAVKWYRLAADQGERMAQYNLGVMYRDGEGVPQDYAEAVKSFRLAADQGFAMAQSNLGLMYDEGQGMPENDAEAVKWYRLAADQGYAEAQCNLGMMYYNGEGTPPDYVEAYAWSSVAAAGGIEQAVKNRDVIAGELTPEQLSQGQQRATELFEKQGSGK